MACPGVLPVGGCPFVVGGPGWSPGSGMAAAGFRWPYFVLPAGHRSAGCVVMTRTMPPDGRNGAGSQP